MVGGGGGGGGGVGCGPPNISTRLSSGTCVPHSLALTCVPHSLTCVDPGAASVIVNCALPTAARPPGRACRLAHSLVRSLQPAALFSLAPNHHAGHDSAQHDASMHDSSINDSSMSHCADLLDLNQPHGYPQHVNRWHSAGIGGILHFWLDFDRFRIPRRCAPSPTTCPHAK